jgi:hypothetical protein
MGRPRPLAKRVIAVLWRNLAKNYRLALEAALVVAVIVGLRALLFAVGLQGISATSLVSSIIAGSGVVFRGWGGRHCGLPSAGHGLPGYWPG